VGLENLLFLYRISNFFLWLYWTV